MSTYAIILISIAFFLLGAGVIGLIWYLRGVSNKMQEKTAALPPVDPNQEELVRLMRDMTTQDLIVWMEGKAYKAAYELPANLKRRLSFTSNVLIQWLEIPAPEPVPEAEAATTPSGEPAEAAPLSAEDMPAPTEAFTMEPPAEYPPAFTDQPEPELKPVSTDISSVVGGILNPASNPAPSFKSIAMQINDILQDQIAGTPLEARGLTLNDGPEHGVMVTLDGQKYLGVKDVPDEEVRKAIRTAVLEWETKK